jgi:hypothetical protein
MSEPGVRGVSGIDPGAIGTIASLGESGVVGISCGIIAPGLSKSGGGGISADTGAGAAPPRLADAAEIMLARLPAFIATVVAVSLPVR